MQVKLEKTFVVSAPPDKVWRFMQDIKGVAECLPGAQITEQTDTRHYNGMVRVKIGPVSTAFNGKVEVQGVDAARRELKLLGKGADVKGASTASMNLTATVRDLGNGTSEVAGVSDVSVTGKLASFGGRMMNDVSAHLMDQFAQNFSARVAASGAQPQSGAGPKELNAFALIFNLLRSYIRRLFKREGKGNT